METFLKLLLSLAVFDCFSILVDKATKISRGLCQADEWNGVVLIRRGQRKAAV